MVSEKKSNTNSKARNEIKMAMSRQLRQFKLEFERYVTTYDVAVFNSEVKRAIQSRGIDLRSEILDEFKKDVKSVDIPVDERNIIWFEYEEELDKLMKSVVRYSAICTTIKELLIVVGGLVAMVTAGYFMLCFVVEFGLTATLTGLAAIIHFVNNVQRPKLA